MAFLRRTRAQRLKLGELMCDPRNPTVRLPVAALAVVRAGASADTAPASVDAPERAGPVRPLGRLIRSPLQVRARTGKTALGRTGTRTDPGGRAAGSMRLLPPPELELAEGDQVLFVGTQDGQGLQQRTLSDSSVIEHLRSGREPPRSAVFRWWASR
jgi:hypothetical protein